MHAEILLSCPKPPGQSQQVVPEARLVFSSNFGLVFAKRVVDFAEKENDTTISRAMKIDQFVGWIVDNHDMFLGSNDILKKTRVFDEEIEDQLHCKVKSLARHET